MSFKVLCVGDVFGKPGRKVLQQQLPLLIEEHDLEFVIVNGENAAGGKGITPEICREFYAWGTDVITTGNHARDKKEIDATLLSSTRVLRPSNYPETTPGKGVGIRESKNGRKIAVINTMGCVHMAKLKSPFEQVLEDIEQAKTESQFIFVDFHAEATSEKRAMAWHLDGKVTAVVGTHTHVQTADEEVLPEGTAYITDLGMTGPYNSVIGMKKELSLNRFLNDKADRRKFEVAKGDVKICGVIITVDEATGKSTKIERVRIDYVLE